MHYLTISFTHKNSTLEIREKLAFADDEKGTCLAKITDHSAVNEAILISTCNRMEVFCSCSSVIDATEHLFTLLAERSGISLEELEGRADVFEDQGAIHHLFSVASSLDSMVVGETQIAGQLKDAYRFAKTHGYCGQKISRAIHRAFKCAAEVRSLTDISSKPVSVASVAVDKAKQQFPDLEHARALVIGAGEMSVIITKHLMSNNADVVLINRTRAKAEAIAEETGCRVGDYEELEKLINECHLLFTSTGSTDPIITREMVHPCSFERHWFDIAVPRDIDNFKYDGITCYQVDDLKSIINENIMLREDEAKAAYVIVGRYTIEFFDWLKTLSVEPMIKEIYHRAFKAAAEETERVIGKGFIPPEYEAALRKSNEQTLKRFLHEMTAKMRDVSGETKSDIAIESLKFLLDIEDEDLFAAGEAE
jgi:glutamyl-tRNA reductase